MKEAKKCILVISRTGKPYYRVSLEKEREKSKKGYQKRKQNKA